MPDAAADSRPASSPSSAPETPARPAGEAAVVAAPPTSHPHAKNVAIAHSTHSAPSALRPPLTPATTTRQSVTPGVLSTLWGGSSAPTVAVPNASTIVPAIITHAPSPSAHEERPSDLLAASTGSVPSATTTLTNTLPPTQSAALRALNAPAFQSLAASKSNKPAKSTSSRTTLSSQPVVVRTYSGSRHSSRSPSGLPSPRTVNMPARSPSALSAGLAGRSEQLPSVEDFSFSAILRAVDPEIRDAIDAIAEICARSRMSLADEYDAHLPPQGEITSTGPGWAAGVGALVGRGRASRVGQGWSAADNTLTAVPEASSSSERLAGESRGSGTAKKRSRSAYGSLKSVISGGSGKGKAANDQHAETDHPSSQLKDRKTQGPAWAVNASSPNHPAITLLASPQASKQLSFDTSSTIRDIPLDFTTTTTPPPGRTLPRPRTAVPKQASTVAAAAHRRQTSVASLPAPQTPRPYTLSSLASWLPWPRPQNLDAKSRQELTQAETRLREMLAVAEHSGVGRGKVGVGVGVGVGVA